MTLPAGSKRPDTYVGINTRTQRTGLPNQDFTTVFVTDDSASNALPQPVFDSADADAKFGENSDVGRMLSAALSLNPAINASGFAGSVVQVLPSCQVQPSAWSNDITLADINHPNQGGALSIWVDGDGSPNYIILDVANQTSIVDALTTMAADITADFGIEVRQSVNNPDNAQIRYVPKVNYSGKSPTEVTMTFLKRISAYVYDASAVGTAGETSLCLSNFFDEAPSVVLCVAPPPSEEPLK